MLREPWASYQIPNIADCACAGNAGNVSPRRRFQRKPLVSDPGMHHGTCVTHVPWCMSGSHACSDGENVPGIPGACAPAILRIWQEAHAKHFVAFNSPCRKIPSVRSQPPLCLPSLSSLFVISCVDDQSITIIHTSISPNHNKSDSDRTTCWESIHPLWSLNGHCRSVNLSGISIA